MVYKLIIHGPSVLFCCLWRPKSKCRICKIGWYNHANVSYSHYTPEVLLCGGSTIDDTVDPSTLSSQIPASNQCARMKLTPAGIAAGWEVETMPDNRLMIDAIVMPDGNVLLINGAATGVSAFPVFESFFFIKRKSTPQYTLDGWLFQRFWSNRWIKCWPPR